MSRHGHLLQNPDRDCILTCPESGYRYREIRPGLLQCLDLEEDAPLPADKAVSRKRYREFKE